MSLQTKEDKIASAKDNMVNEGGPIVEDANKTFRDVRKDTKDGANYAKDQMKDIAGRANGKAENMLSSTVGRLGETGPALMRQIIDHPLRSGLIALGLGAAVRSLCRQK